MRRSIIMLLTAISLALGISSSVGAQFEVIGSGHIEVPEHGYAIKFPKDWVVIRADDALFESYQRDALGRMTGDIEEVQQLLHHRDRTRSWSVHERAMGIRALSMDAVELFGDALTNVSEPEMLPVRVGDVARISYDLEFEGVVLQTTVFVFDDGEAFVYLTCGGSERADDEWLAIAESFEFLPAEL